MIIVWYEMQCDTCGCAEHFRDTKERTVRQSALRRIAACEDAPTQTQRRGTTLMKGK